MGKDLLSYLKPRLKKTKIIAIDAPLTLGPGKGKMRLWEKFFSTKPFRRLRVNPIPPAAIWRLSYHGQEVVANLKSYGFILDENLIEVFPTFAKKVIKRLPKIPCLSAGRPVNENQRDAFVAAFIAWCHLQKKTFWVGHRDGKLFLPAFSFWKKIWYQRFLKWWRQKHPFKYKFLQIGGYP